MSNNGFTCRLCGHDDYDIQDTTEFRFCRYCGVLFLDQDSFNLETIGIELTNSDARLPIKSKDGDSGFDLFAPERGAIMCGDTDVIKLGFKIQLPHNTEAQIRPRSGLALKQGIQVGNSPGTIDSGYRGEVGIIIYNSHPELQFNYEKWDKIGQMVIKRALPYSLEIIGSVDETDRGSGGFGSTGGHKDL